MGLPLAPQSQESVPISMPTQQQEQDRWAYPINTFDTEEDQGYYGNS